MSVSNRVLYENDKLKLKQFKQTIGQEVAHKKKVAAKIKASKQIAAGPRPPQKTKFIAQQIFNRFKSLSSKPLPPPHNYILTSEQRHSCLTRTNDFTRIKLSQMKMNKIHFNAFLECTIQDEPYYAAANVAHFLVSDTGEDEDCENCYENLVVYNFGSYFNNNGLIARGTRFVINEPHLQMFDLGEFDFGIRVDSPSNINVCFVDVDER
jgi:hypothetical protein